MMRWVGYQSGGGGGAAFHGGANIQGGLVIR